MEKAVASGKLLRRYPGVLVAGTGLPMETALGSIARYNSCRQGGPRFWQAGLRLFPEKLLLCLALYPAIMIAVMGGLVSDDRAAAT